MIGAAGPAAICASRPATHFPSHPAADCRGPLAVWLRALT